jgi:hypothetical protein
MALLKLEASRGLGATAEGDMAMSGNLAMVCR